MSRIPQSFLDDLLSRIDIVDVIDHRVKLRRSGKNYSACCPFHDEKTPSFTVSPDKQFYYCFGCGANGTAINFLMEYERSSFIDSVESLASIAGIEVPREQNPQQDLRDQRRKSQLSILERSAEYYTEQLRQHPHKEQAVTYLKNRGLSGHIAKAYEIGYAPPGWDNLLLKLGQNEHDQKLLIETGLCIDKPEENKRYDRFRHRIMFPIRDSRGRTIGFGGRVLGEDKPKYLNSPETDVFHKGQELYGLYEAKKFQKDLSSLIVVEGYMDVIALAQYGLWNSVATLGTACGEEHLRLAFRHVSEVIFCFDGDRAGKAAARRALLNSLSAMEDGRQIRFLFLPDGQDPDSLIRQIGAERFKAQMQQGLPLEEFLFDVAAEGINLDSMDGRARFSKIAAPLIHNIPDGVFKSLIFENLAKRTGLSREILSEFTELPPQLIETATTAEEPAPPAPDTTPTPHVPPTSYDRFNEEVLTPHRDETPPPQTFTHKSKLELSPARTAIILLLDRPELLKHSDTSKTLPECLLSDPEIKNLSELIQYLQKRPDANFNNIMGFWGGKKGVDAQQSLTKLAASQVFGSLKTIEFYDPIKELNACLNAISKRGERETRKLELKRLTQKGLSNLNSEEKKRYVELIRHS